MFREYHKWYSPILERDMELLVFGQSGPRLIFFPTRTARFYDYENFGVIEAMRKPIEQGRLQVYCLDSIDQESFYCNWCHPSGRINRHVEYEQYVMEEVLPFSFIENSNNYVISAGCSLGAYHAVNIALKYPQIFKKTLGMSGRYDLTKPLGVFRDLFDGYFDENIFNNMPSLYIPKISEERSEQLRKMEIILVIGKEDIFFENNLDLSTALKEKQIPHHLYIWNEEAHKPKFWKEMVKLYL